MDSVALGSGVSGPPGVICPFGSRCGDFGGQDTTGS